MSARHTVADPRAPWKCGCLFFSVNLAFDEFPKNPNCIWGRRTNAKEKGGRTGAGVMSNDGTGGPVGPASRLTATSNVDVGQTTYPVNTKR